MDDSISAASSSEGRVFKNFPQEMPLPTGGVGPPNGHTCTTPQGKPARLRAELSNYRQAVSEEVGNEPARGEARRRDGSGEPDFVRSAARGSGAAAVHEGGEQPQGGWRTRCSMGAQKDECEGSRRREEGRGEDEDAQRSRAKRARTVDVRHVNGGGRRGGAAASHCAAADHHGHCQPPGGPSVGSDGEVAVEVSSAGPSMRHSELMGKGCSGVYTEIDDSCDGGGISLTPRCFVATPHEAITAMGDDRLTTTDLLAAANDQARKRTGVVVKMRVDAMMRRARRRRQFWPPRGTRRGLATARRCAASLRPFGDAALLIMLRRPTCHGYDRRLGYTFRGKVYWEVASWR